jgi:hypothetical protein
MGEEGTEEEQGKKGQSDRPKHVGGKGGRPIE